MDRRPSAAVTASGLVQGTLHMLILKTLALEPLHGYGIGVRLLESAPAEL